MNSEIEILKLLGNNLDEYTKSHIYSFLPHESLFWVEKKIYIKNHSHLQTRFNNTSSSLYNNYIRFIIRNDFDFILKTILNQHNTHSWGSKKINYGRVKYRNYFHFLDCFMFENNSHKCRELLFTIVFRKKYKKIYRSIAWSN